MCASKSGARVLVSLGELGGSLVPEDPGLTLTQQPFLVQRRCRDSLGSVALPNEHVNSLSRSAGGYTVCGYGNVCVVELISGNPGFLYLRVVAEVLDGGVHHQLGVSSPLGLGQPVGLVRQAGYDGDWPVSKRHERNVPKSGGICVNLWENHFLR